MTYYNPYEEQSHQPETPRQSAEEPKPAVSRRKPKAKKAETEISMPAALTDRRWRLFFGIVFMVAACFALVACVSWIMTASADQSTIQYNDAGQMVRDGLTVANAGGPVGARIGNFLINGFLGVGSLVLIFYVFAIGLKLFGKWNFKFWPMTFKCLLLSVSLSMVVGLLTFASSGVIRWGGDHGYYANRFLIDYTSVFGAICASIVLVSLICILYLAELAALYRSYRRKMDAIKARRAEEQRRKEAEKSHLANEMKESPLAEAEPEADPEEAAEDPDVDPMELEAADEPAAEPANLEEPEEFVVETREIEAAEHIQSDTFDPTAELSHYHFPSIDLLVDRSGNKVTVDAEEQEANKERIIKALEQFNIKISSIKATVGPTVTLFEVVPAEGQRIAAIKRVEEDLALALKAQGIRIIAPIPGRGTIGIEVPNNEPQVVSMRSIIASRKFQECKYELPMAMGATISNEVFIADLTKMPHLLVAGATGQGKSVGLNAIIASLLYKKHPAELKFVLVDPKMVEFSLYRVLERHYLAKLPDEEDAVITDCNKVINTLKSLCVEMDRRYELLSAAGVRGVKEYNQKFIAKQLNPEKGHRYMPYIVLVVDEFADLIMVAGRDIEDPICRLAQKARAIGIHVILATQRPSTNVITGLIKANFPGRIAFRVSQSIDSKTILDRMGAQQLVGRGDMFFSTNGNMERVQCAFIDTPEVEAICDSIADQAGFVSAYELPEVFGDGDGSSSAGSSSGGVSLDRDPLFEEAARFILSTGNSSTSSLQRRYAIGYNRAGKLMDQLEAFGVVGQASGSKPRPILMDMMTFDLQFQP